MRPFDLVGVEVVGVEAGADDIPMLALVTSGIAEPDGEMYKEFI